MKETNTDKIMHNNITIRVISLVKDHQWKMLKIKLLSESLHRIKIICQLADTLFFRKKVNNIRIEIYIMHSIRVWFFFVDLFFVDIYRSSTTPL